MVKVKDVKDAAKEYAKDQQRMWRETNRSPANLRKLEGRDTNNKKKRDNC